MKLAYCEILLVLLSLVFASPFPFCNVENSILSSLHADSGATSFCSKFLAISTSTTTVISTTSTPKGTVTASVIVTPSPIAVTSTQTVTITSNIVSTETFEVTSTVTSTSTSATCSLSFYGPAEPAMIHGASSSQGQTATPNAVTHLTNKRNAPPPFTQHPGNVPTSTPNCLHPYPTPFISFACSCLAIPTPKTSVTSATTVAGPPVTSTATFTSLLTSTTTTTVTTVQTIFGVVRTTLPPTVITAPVTITSTEVSVTEITSTFNDVHAALLAGCTVD